MQLFDTEFASSSRPFTATGTAATTTAEIPTAATGLQKYPVRFADLTDTKALQLCEKRLVKVLPAVGQLAHVCTEAYLCCNDLTRLPAEIGYLSRLTVLSLERNRLASLPDSIGLLTGLTTLKLNHNRLTELPPSLFALTRLVTLNVSHNVLFTVPHELGNLQALTALDLSFNPIRVLPMEVSQLKQLRRFFATLCPFMTSLPAYEPGRFHIDEDAQLSGQVPSLAALAACVVSRNGIALDSLPDNCRQLMSQIQHCNFCHGPWLHRHVKQYRWWTKNDVTYPLEYRMCSSHWFSEQERVRLMFGELPNTAPAATYTDIGTQQAKGMSFRRQPAQLNSQFLKCHTNAVDQRGMFNRVMDIVHYNKKKTSDSKKETLLPALPGPMLKPNRRFRLAAVLYKRS